MQKENISVPFPLFLFVLATPASDYRYSNDNESQLCDTFEYISRRIR